MLRRFFYGSNGGNFEFWILDFGFNRGPIGPIGLIGYL